MSGEVTRPPFSIRRSLDLPRFRRRTSTTDHSTSPSGHSPSPERRQRSSSNAGVGGKPRLPRQRSVRDFFRNQVSNIAAWPHTSDSDQATTTTHHSRGPTKDSPENAIAEDSAAGGDASTVAQHTASAWQNQHGGHLSTLLEVPQGVAISEEQLQKMFHGAPSFRVDSSRYHPLPRATYADLDPESFMEVNDFRDFLHSSFQLCTLQTSDGNNFLSNAAKASNNVVECPSMLSANGLEPGTVGMNYFLTLPLAELTPNSQSGASQPKRLLLLTDPSQLGLRGLRLEDCITRLAEHGDEQARLLSQDEDEAVLPNETKIVELYDDLFGKLLRPPSGEARSKGLDVQIAALIKVLGMSDIWFDLNHSESRLYIAQVLWQASSDPDDRVALLNHHVLLFQLTLAAELSHRIDMKHALAKQNATPDGGPRRKEVISSKIAWDLVLAKRFLQNVRIAAETPDSKTLGKSIRNSVLSTLSFVTARENITVQDDVRPVFYPRREGSQLQGLQAFAKALDWPLSAELKETIASHTAQHAATTAKAYSRPVGTPGFRPDDQASYFGVLIRPTATRSVTSQSLELLSPTVSSDQPTSLNSAGWLTRSWLTGLVMPGEAACSLLMAALLENSGGALEALGATPNFGGGFYYKSRSYWSKTSIVGRVLGAMVDAKDCMGWVSVPRRTDNREDGWISIDSQIPPSSHALPRIKFSNDVTADSAPYPASADHAAAFNDTDFAWPSDGPPDPNSQVQAITLDFAPSEKTFELPTPPGDHTSSHGFSTIPTYAALLSFSPPPSTNYLTRTALDLRYEVHFVSSQPCFPKLRGPPGATGRSNTVPSTPPSAYARSKSPPVLPGHVRSRIGSAGHKELPAPPCHPLHVRYKWEAIPALAILGEDEQLAVFVKDVQRPTTPVTVRAVPSSVPAESKPIEVTEAISSTVTPTSNAPSTDPQDKTPPSVETGSIDVPQTTDSDDTTTAHTLLAPAAAETASSPLDEPTTTTSTGSEAEASANEPIEAGGPGLVGPDTPDATLSIATDPVEPSTTETLKTSHEDSHARAADDKVILLDARGGSGLQLLCRAWCASVGEHALIGRANRTCVACCVREAKALGMRIVIRV